MNTIKHYLILSVVCIFSNGVAQTFTNPIADLPDPFITYIDGYYYYTGTTGVTLVLSGKTTFPASASVTLVLSGKTNVI